VASHPMPDKEWCEMVASYSSDELLAAGTIAANQWETAQRIITQQALVPLLSDCRPTEDTESN
jgi:hypothetical protein